MLNTQRKELVLRKGFTPLFNRAFGNEIVFVIPGDLRVRRMNKENVAWLESLNDVVLVKNPFPGFYPQDMVQIFESKNDFKYWGKIGKIRDVNLKQNTAWVSVRENKEDAGTVISFSLNDVVVVDRKITNLTGLSKEERDAAILAMSAKQQEDKTE